MKSNLRKQLFLGIFLAIPLASFALAKVGFANAYEPTQSVHFVPHQNIRISQSTRNSKKMLRSPAITGAPEKKYKVPVSRSFPRSTRVATVRVLTTGLSAPSDVAFLGTDYYVVETLSGQIRRVNSSGVKSFVAGGLYLPYGVVQNSGNLYVTEPGRGYVKRVTTNGQITNLLDYGYGYNDRTIFRIGSISRKIVIPSNQYNNNRFDVDEYDLTSSTNAQFFYDGSEPSATQDIFAIASGVYIAAKDDGCIYKLFKDTSSNYQNSLIACGLGNLQSVDQLGTNYVVSDANGRLLRVTPLGVVTTISTGLGSLGGLIVRNGKIIVTDATGGRLLEVTP